MVKEEGAIRLDQLLCLWEDFCFIQNIRIQISSIFGRIESADLMRPLYWEEFRKYILGYKGGIVDFARYIADSSTGNMSSIPLSVLAWNHHSRRIFHLAEESQILLDTTSLGGIRWKDIKFPFESFLLTLEEPLIDLKGVAYDALLLTRLDQFIPSQLQTRGDELIELRLLPRKLDGYKNFSKNERKRMAVDIHNRNDENILKFLNDFKRIGDYQTPTIHIFTKTLSEEIIKDSIPKLGNLTGQADMVKDMAIDSALHLVLNLCLYLENYPPQQSPKKKTPIKHKKKKGFDANAIKDEADIFTVRCHFNMTRGEIENLVEEEKAAKKERIVGAYWRRAHWRRKPYCGHIPMNIAPKDWIPRKHVNSDRLPAKSLPSGSKATLK